MTEPYMTEIEDTGRPLADEALIAWLAGELGPAESLALVKRMLEDAELRERAERTAEALEAARAWLREEAPGIERVERLEIPRLRPEPGEVIARRDWSWSWPGGALARGVAAALIFAVGILIGGGLRTRPEVIGRPAGPVPVAASPTPARQPSIPPTVEATPEPARARPARRVHEENGRVVIETTLAASGGRAVWVVDGGFQVASGK